MIKIAWSPLYNHPLPEGHRFPMEKYDLIRAQLLHEGTYLEENFFIPPPLEEDALLQIHDDEYVNRCKKGLLAPKELRKTGFPYSPELIVREEFLTSGTVQAALFALDNGAAFNIAGGTHHAFRDRGEGFCIYNDIAVAAQHLLFTAKARKILVVDLDVHQGNGTAAIFHGNDKVFTFSMHGEHNYPLHKESSDLDIGFRDGIGDAEYLGLLESNLPEIIESFRPDFIFFQSGVDVLSTDKLGRLSLSMQGCKMRDYIVLETARKHSIPITSVMGGGYSSRISDISEAHCQLFRLALDLFS